MSDDYLEDDDLMEEESEDSSKKKKKKKPKKQKQAKGRNKITVPWQMMFLAIWVGAAISIAGILLLSAKPIESSMQEKLSQGYDKQGHILADKAIKTTEEQLASLSNSQFLQSMLLRRKAETGEFLSAIDLEAFAFPFKHATQLTFIPWDYSGTAGLKSKGIELQNNIEMMMISKAGDKDPAAPEAYQIGKDWVVSFVSPVITDGEVIGVLMLNMSGRYLDDIASSISSMENTKAVFRHERNKKILGQSGRANSLVSSTNTVFKGINLELSYDTNIKQSIESSFKIAYILVCASTLIVSLLTIVFGRMTFQSINADAVSIVHFTDALSGLHKTQKPKLQNSIFNKVTNAIESLGNRTTRTGFTPDEPDRIRAPKTDSPPPERSIATPDVDMGDDGSTVINTSVRADSGGDDFDLGDDDDFDLGDEDNFSLDSGSDGATVLNAAVSSSSPTKLENKHIFRDYDIRGKADQELTPEVISIIGKGIATHAKNQGADTLCVGRDGRLSSPAIFESLSQGIMDAGLNVIDIGVCTSPMLYYSAMKLSNGSGVMITGSHKSAEYNGLKIQINGAPCAGEELQGILAKIEAGHLENGQGSLSSNNLTQDYIDEISNDIIIAKSMNVVIDASNGPGGELAQAALNALNCNVTVINGEIDGNFPGHSPDPSNPDNLEKLALEVQAQNADLGIAFDGDADRMAVVSSSGAIISSDHIMMLLARDITSRNPGASIVYDVKCSLHLGKLIKQFGGRPIMWKTGHSNMKQKISETNALFGGEYTGHFYFKERWHGFDDGIYAALRLIEMLASDLLPLDAYINELPKLLGSQEYFIPVSDDNIKKTIVGKLEEALASEEGELITIDGVRLERGSCWGLVRASNTDSKLTARFEAGSEEELASIKQLFKEKLAAINGSLEIPF